MNTHDDLFHDLPRPWNRILPYMSAIMVWGMLFGVIWLLRSFFLLLFLTFVFSYIQERGVRRLADRIRARIPRVLLVSFILWSLLTAAGIFLVPQVKAQATVFAGQFRSYLVRVDEEVTKLIVKYPLLEKVLPQAQDKTPENGKPSEDVPTENANNNGGGAASVSAALMQQLLGFGEGGHDGAKNLNQAISTIGNIGGKIAAAASSFLLALLFSFLIVLDLPDLSAKVRDLENTRLRFLYLSVAENIREFSLVLGRALEAQLIIAMINSILTAIGISMLGLAQHVAFLSVIVFLCSFLPVIGVFISSVPICLIALQVSGLQTMLLAILLVTVIHLIEGYVLNPRIYGSYMRINSVIVLIILTIAGKLFNFWGLLLGVPVCTYIFGHAIRFAADKADAKETTARPQAQSSADEKTA
ncbi:MAG: AI-2E family transporter [Desulfobulbaceae bacterium]|jgi:predicted PurR-regulated permease PerM|nr:AI-2E family transporter [Desulfobulbaceae bacterium]